jgi:hypothetical protein
MAARFQVLVTIVKSRSKKVAGFSEALAVQQRPAISIKARQERDLRTLQSRERQSSAVTMMYETTFVTEDGETRRSQRNENNDIGIQVPI